MYTTYLIYHAKFWHITNFFDSQALFSNNPLNVIQRVKLTWENLAGDLYYPIGKVEIGLFAKNLIGVIQFIVFKWPIRILTICQPW